MVLGRHPANTDLDDVDYTTTPPTYLGLKQGEYRLPSLICSEAMSLLRAHTGSATTKQVSLAAIRALHSTWIACHSYSHM